MPETPYPPYESKVRTSLRENAKKPEDFIDHLLAMPSVGADSDFDRPRSGPRQIDLGASSDRDADRRYLQT